MKYYFITYQATNQQGSVSIWNQVINVSPMKFIKHVQSFEETRYTAKRIIGGYANFIVINTCEITASEFNEYDGYF